MSIKLFVHKCFFSLFGFIPLFLISCATPKAPQRIQQVDADVYYGGVYLVAGNVDEIPVRFPNYYKRVAPVDSAVKKDLRELMSENRESFTNINLKGFVGDLATDDAIIMANAFTSEKYFSEAVEIAGERVRNVRAYLGGALLLQNFQRKPEGGFDISLLACYPYSMTCIDLVGPGSSPEQAGGEALTGLEMGILSPKYRDIILNVAGKVAPVTGLGAKMQVRNVSMAETILEFAQSKFGDDKSFRQWIAGEAGAQLAKQIGMSVIPFAEDTSSRKLAQMMESGEAYNIALPNPDYVIDIDLTGFSVQKAKETTTEAVWVYGAYGKFTILEAGTGAVRWQQELKAGVPKRVALTQVDIDHSVAQFVALLGLIESFPKEMLADKKALPIIKACLK